MHSGGCSTVSLAVSASGVLKGFCVAGELHRGLQKEELVLLTHGDSVDKVADGFKVVAQSGNIIAGEQHTRTHTRHTD